jgi:hypothetical protein
MLHQSTYVEELLQKALDEQTRTPVLRSISLLLRVYGCDTQPESTAKSVSEGDVAFVTETVRNYWDKSLPEYCSVLATCIVGLGVAGKSKFPPQMLEGVNEILENRGSDQAEATCSMLRAASMAMFPAEEDEISHRWSRRFWNTNYRLSSCEFHRE